MSDLATGTHLVLAPLTAQPGLDSSLKQQGFGVGHVSRVQQLLTLMRLLHNTEVPVVDGSKLDVGEKYQLRTSKCTTQPKYVFVVLQISDLLISL